MRAVIPIYVGICTLLPLLPLGAQTTSERSLTLEDLRSIRTIRWVDVSPDGQRIGYLATGSEEEGGGLWTVAPDGNQPQRVADADRIQTMIGWSPDSEGLAFVSSVPQGRSIRIRSSTRTDGIGCNVSNTARSFAWLPDGDRIAFADQPGQAEDAPRQTRAEPRISSDRPPGERIFVCTLASQRITRLTDTTFFGPSFDWSPSASQVVVSAQREPGFYGALETDVFLVDVTDGSVKPLVVRPGVDRSPVWSPDGGTIAFVSGFGHSGLLPNLGVAVIGVDEDQPADIGRGHDRGGFFEGPYLLGWSADSRELYYAVVDGVRTPLFSLTVKTGARERLSEDWGDGQLTHTYRLSEDGRIIAFQRSARDRPPELYSITGEQAKPVRLTSLNRSLRHLGVSRETVVGWTAPDGLELEGLLLTPSEDRDQAPYPLVTVLHGGPASAYTLGFPGLRFFNPYWSQLLVARGYAVFLPNPRGSGGYGQDFRSAAKGDWSDGPTSDVLSGIDSLVAAGVVDPARLTLAGWSYGGYLTAWILTRTDRFRAASVGAGIVDLTSHFGQSTEQMVEYFEGGPWRRGELYRTQSPVSYADRISTPTLVFHGINDESVSPSQSELLHATLEVLGTETVLVRYPGEGHSLRHAGNQDHAWEWFERWIEKHR